ncbi:MAG: hypothetical protein DMG69_17055 [Acidobacteria bacterium]|nr:MAG: hypothetical protein DMG69_17055 [Acidobacteriota bacterium]
MADADGCWRGVMGHSQGSFAVKGDAARTVDAMIRRMREPSRLSDSRPSGSWSKAFVKDYFKNRRRIFPRIAEAHFHEL